MAELETLRAGRLASRRGTASCRTVTRRSAGRRPLSHGAMLPRARQAAPSMASRQAAYCVSAVVSDPNRRVGGDTPLRMPIGAALAWDDDHFEVTVISGGEATYLVTRIRGGSRKRQQPRVGAPDRALTPNAGLAAVTELCGRLGVIEAIDDAAGPIKQRARGFSAGELLTGIAAAQLAGEDFLVGLDRQCADAAGQQLTPVPGLSSTTAAGLARRITPAQWLAVERASLRSPGG